MAKIADLKEQARELERQGEFAKALLIYQHVLAHLEGKPQLATQLPLYVKAGDLLAKLGRADEAVESYETAASHFAQAGNGRNVAALCLKAFQIDPSRADLFRMWAAQLLDKGHREAARVVLLEYAKRLRLEHAADALERVAGEPPHAVEPLVRQVLGLGVGTDLPVESAPAAPPAAEPPPVEPHEPSGEHRAPPPLERASARTEPRILSPQPPAPHADPPARADPDAGRRVPSAEHSATTERPAQSIEPAPAGRRAPSAEPPRVAEPARPLRGSAGPTAVGSSAGRGVPGWVWAAGVILVLGGGAYVVLGRGGDEPSAGERPVPPAATPADSSGSDVATGDSLAGDPAGVATGDSAALAAAADTAAGPVGDLTPPVADPLDTLRPVPRPIPDPVAPLDTSVRVPPPALRLPAGVAGPVVVVEGLALDSVIETGAGPSRTVRVVQTLASGERVELTMTPFAGADTMGIGPPRVTSVGDLSAGTVRAGAWLVNARARVPVEELQAALRRLTILRP